MEFVCISTGLNIRLTDKQPTTLTTCSNSDDELSFVCPLLDEPDPDNNDHLRSPGHHQRNRISTPATPAGRPAGWDMDSLKELNYQECEMLARKETAFAAKLSLEAQIDQHNEHIHTIESELLQPNTGLELRERKHLEDRLVRTEMLLNECNTSMVSLIDDIHGLEMDHCALIVRRRKFENEALQLSRFSGGLRAKSLMHLPPTTARAMTMSASSSTASTTQQPTTPTSPTHQAAVRQKQLSRSASTGVAPPAESASSSPVLPNILITTSYTSSVQSMEQSLSDDNTNTTSSGSRTSRSHSPPPPMSTTMPTMTSTLSQTDVHARIVNDDDDDDSAVQEAIEVRPDQLDDDNAGGDGGDSRDLCFDVPVCCRMQALRHKIAYEKARLMKNLESNCEKRILDVGIDRLQELQRQYMSFEMRLAFEGPTAVCIWHKDQHDVGELLHHPLAASGGSVSEMHSASGRRYASGSMSRSNQSSCEWLFCGNFGGTQSD